MSAWKNWISEMIPSTPEASPKLFASKSVALVVPAHRFGEDIGSKAAHYLKF